MVNHQLRHDDEPSRLGTPIPHIHRDHDEVSKSTEHYDSPCYVTHVVTFLFSFLYKDNHDDDEEAHENRAADVRCGPSCCRWVA